MFVFGVLFILGGYALAFTTVGAVMIFIGCGMLVTGFMLVTRLSSAISVLAGLATAIALTTYGMIDLSQRH